MRNMDPPPPYCEENLKPVQRFEQTEAGGVSAVSLQPPLGRGRGQGQAQGRSSQGGYPIPHTTVHFQQERILNGNTQPAIINVTNSSTFPVVGAQQILVAGNCPSCRIGFLREEFDVCGILLAIFCFPVGILCCLCMMEKRCSHCSARF